MAARTQLSTFKFDKPPSTMSEEELHELADRILDQWSAQIEASTRLGRQAPDLT